jgi:PGF-pre-PGF domain-containing protein
MKLLYVLLTMISCLFVLQNNVNASNVALIENSIWGSNLTGVFHSSLVFGDIDNDNDDDLIIMGCNAGTVDTCATADKIKVYINNGSSFVENYIWKNNLTSIGYGSLALGDIDNDGDLDLVVMGDTGGGNGVVKIYTNNGTTFIENYTWQQNLIGVDAYAGSLALGDIDNDGNLDLVLVGASQSSDNGVYINNGTTFVKKTEWLSSLPYVGHGLGMGAIGLTDIDNDNDLDLIFLGSRSTNFYRGIYINNGTSLVEDSSWEQSLNNIFGWPSLTIGDFNSDNKMDLACMGTRSGDHLYIYQNNGTQFSVNTTDDSFGSACFPGYFDGSIHLGDYDNDGDLDLAVIGKEPGRAKIIEQGITNPWGCPFANDDTAHLNISNQIIQGSLAWNDVNNDGRLDIGITGLDGSDYIANIYINNGTSINNAPVAPNSDLNSSFNFLNGKLTLSWGNGSDAETTTLGLYYNLRVGTCSSCHNVVSGVYGGGDDNGYFGNMMQRKRIVLNRPDLENKTIYWAVQIIDTGLAKSAWSTEQVYHITQQCTENWAYGGWSSCINSQQTRTATDLNGCRTTVNRSAVVQTCSSAPSGGSPSGSSLPPSITVQNKSRVFENVTWYFEKIDAGVDTGFIINDTGLPVHQVWVKVKNEIENVAIDIKKLANRPSFILKEPEGSVYQYLNITYYNLNDSNIESGKIRFKVDKFWLNDNSINKATVVLNRYYNDNWQKLNTELKNEESNYFEYQVETPGFSIFSITGEVQEATACAPMEKRCEGNELQECAADGKSWTTKESCEHGCGDGKCKEEAAEFSAANPYAWLIAAVVIVVVAAGIALGTKKPMWPKLGPS